MRISSLTTVAVRSFAKINLGLYIGAARADGFHELRTVYQTIALHDVIRVSFGGSAKRGVEQKSGRGGGIEIVCEDERVPLDSSNTCYHMAERVMEELGAAGRVRIEIDKRLPVQGGLGAASSNAVATMVALERGLKRNYWLRRGCGLRRRLDRICLYFSWVGRCWGWGAARKFIRWPIYPRCRWW